MHYFVYLLLVLATAAAQSPNCGWPARQPGSTWSSTQFYQQQINPSVDREVAVIHEVLKGNIPDRLRQFVPLQIPVQIGGAGFHLELQVAPDYLMIGIDSDFVRAPLTNYAAQYLASQLGFVLPTPYLVDQIYAHANTQLTPQPTDWYLNSPTMRLGPNYLIFNQVIETQRAGRGGLIAGHKKDVVLTNLLDAHPSRVAIYGWQEPGGHPIQPIGTPHNFTYEDYSHGIRFLASPLKVINDKDGSTKNWSLPEALKDPVLGPLLTGGQDPIHDVRAARTCPTAFIQLLGLPDGCPAQPRNCP